MNDLNDEIDLLIDETNSNPPASSTASENFNSWHNDYFEQNDFYSDLFPNQLNMPVSSNNNNTHELTSNSLTLT
jgi:hypothetical protein